LTEQTISVTLDGISTDDDGMLFLMDEISRGARKAFDDHAQPLGLCVTKTRSTYPATLGDTMTLSAWI